MKLVLALDIPRHDETAVRTMIAAKDNVVLAQYLETMWNNGTIPTTLIDSSPVTETLRTHEIAWLRTSPVHEAWCTVIAECACGHECSIHERSEHLARVMAGDT